MATWSGSVSIKANTRLSFYKADKNGKITGSAWQVLSLSKPVNFTTSTKEITSASIRYLKSCSAIITALNKAADSDNSSGITTDFVHDIIKKISNTACYLQITNTMSVTTTSSSSSGSSSSKSDLLMYYESGTIQMKVGSKVTVFTSPGGSVAMTLYPRAGSGKYLEIKDSNITYHMRNGIKYIRVTSSVQQAIKLYTSQTVPTGDWICVDGSNVKVANTKAKGSNKDSYSKNTSSSSSSKDANSASDETEASVVSASINLKSGANKVDLSTNSTLNDLMSKSMQGIYGIPYQWMDIADRRIDGSKFGRKYAEKIAARMPLLFLTPCRPAFLSGAKKDQKNNILSALWQGDKTITSDLMDTLLGDVSKDGISRYYTTNFAYEEYFRYVNVCCQVTAKLLHLDNSKGSPIRDHGIRIGGNVVNDLSRFNWAKALKKDFTDYFSSASAIPFYINANVSVSESISNDTMESSLAGTVKSKSEQAKELSFLLNTAGSASGDGIVSKAVGGLNSLAEKFQSNASAANLITSVQNSMSSIAAGGSMIFPELWSSSSMGRSYQIDIKLRSPDGDALSIYLNVLVPLYHLLALAAPQMSNNNYNIYYSPFLVKAYCKSMFNIDMGLITSMDISKGKEGDWNANGMPTSIDVSLTIKDLYDIFSLTPYDDKIDITNPVLDVLGVSKSTAAKKIVRNTSMMDYLCNNAGLNLNQGEVIRQATVYKMLRENTILNWPNNKWLQLQQTVDNGLAKIYRAGANNRK